MCFGVPRLLHFGDKVDTIERFGPLWPMFGIVAGRKDSQIEVERVLSQSQPWQRSSAGDGRVRIKIADALRTTT